VVETASYGVLIDHHLSTRPDFEVNWIEISQPATAQMIFHLVEQLPIEITPDIAQCLMCGLSTDTGHFRFTNVTPDTFRAAARLTECGADGSVIAFKTFDERSYESTHVLGMALSRMQSGCEGQLMWTALAAKDFENGAGEDSSENVVNFLRNVRGARMAIMMREKGDENGTVTRISVRSEADLRADLFCARFSGGGHAAAAGGRIRNTPFEESVRIIVKAACEWLAEDHPEVA
jgi:phosphoesterase RecJ-like protein